MSQYFPKPYKPFGGDINVKIDLSNYAAKSDLKNATGINTSKLKLNLASLKAEIDKIDLEKLNNEVVKKTVSDKLVAKVNNIDISGFVLKTKYDIDKSDLENKIRDADKKVPKKTDYNTKTGEIENKIPSIGGLATNSALTAVENKISKFSNLVKKTDFDAKKLDIEKKVTDHDHDKYITTPEFNKLTADNFAARSAQASLLTKADFDNKQKGLNRKINSNKTKDVLVENKF